MEVITMVIEIAKLSMKFGFKLMIRIINYFKRVGKAFYTFGKMQFKK